MKSDKELKPKQTFEVSASQSDISEHRQNLLKLAHSKNIITFIACIPKFLSLIEKQASELKFHSRDKGWPELLAASSHLFLIHNVIEHAQQELFPGSALDQLLDLFYFTSTRIKLQSIEYTEKVEIKMLTKDQNLLTAIGNYHSFEAARYIYFHYHKLLSCSEKILDIYCQFNKIFNPLYKSHSLPIYLLLVEFNITTLQYLGEKFSTANLKENDSLISTLIKDALKLLTTVIVVIADIPKQKKELGNYFRKQLKNAYGADELKYSSNAEFFLFSAPKELQKSDPLNDYCDFINTLCIDRFGISFKENYQLEAKKEAKRIFSETSMRI